MPVYKDEKRSTWYVKYRYKDWRGDIINSTKRGFKTRKEAMEWERNFLVLKAGDMEMTMPEFVETYNSDRLPRLKESTKQSKKRIIEKILPDFEKKKMCDIKASDVVKWQNSLLEYRDPVSGKPYSTSYVKSMHVQLSALFNHANKFYGLRNNPARIAGNVPGSNTMEMQIWTPEEYKKFQDTLNGNMIAYYAFEMLYWTGMRRGEMLALTQEDFDIAAKTVRINKTFHYLKGKAFVTPPKTNRSNRTISLPDFLCDELQQYFTMLFETDKNARVFPILPNSVNYLMRKGIKAAGLKYIRVHDLRHSHVSLLISMGFNPVAIAQRVGHEAIEVTYRYAHLLPNAQNEVAEKLNTLNMVSA